MRATNPLRHPLRALPALLIVAAAALTLCAACNKPQPAPQSQPAPTSSPSGALTQTNPAGPTFFEARDAKPSYQVTLSRTPNAPDALTLQVVPVGSYKINKDYPASFTLDSGEAFDTDRFQVSDQAATLPLPGLSPAQAGGELRFSVCTPQHCDMHQVRIPSPSSAPPAKATEATL